MSDELDFSEGVPVHLDKAIRMQANRVARIGRGLVDQDDLISEVYVHMVRRPATYSPYWNAEEQSRYSMNTFSTIVYRVMLRWLNSERAARTGGSKDDAFYYNTTLIEELLPDVFNIEDRTFAVFNDEDPEAKRHRTMPSQGGGRAAMLVDVRRALEQQTPEDQNYLRLRFAGTGHTHAYCAKDYEITESASRKKQHRIIVKMADALGGDLT